MTNLLTNAATYTPPAGTITITLTGGIEADSILAMAGRTAEVPAGPVWVHCGSGYRAGVAASILDRAGRDTVHVDAAFDAAADAGLTVTTDPQG